MIRPITSLLCSVLLVGAAHAAPPSTDTDGITRIHLDQYNGYFSARETLAGLKPGKYEFTITNKTDKLAGFLIQDAGDHAKLDMFPIEPGQTRTTTVDIDSDGFRYRCPINPTPWYDVEVSG